jgi:hypothetical protein
MRYRQLVVLEVFCDDDAFDAGWPRDWPWQAMAERHLRHEGHSVEHLEIHASCTTDAILDDGNAEDDYEYQPGYWRYKHTEPEHTPYHVNVYAVGQGYGGAEEGGWWFSTGDPIPEACEVYETAEAAEIARKALAEQWPRTDNQFSVLGGEDYDVRIEDHPPQAWPAARPHYC